MHTLIYMRRLAVGLLALCAGLCLAADNPTAASSPPAVSLCSNAAGAPACKAPAKDLKAARQAFSRGLKFEHAKNLDDAYFEFDQATKLIPQNVEYLTAREMTREQLIAQHLQRGNRNLQEGRQVEALAEFRLALNLDPQNEFAQQRLRDAVGSLPVPAGKGPQVVAEAENIQLQPSAGLRDVHYAGDSRGLYQAIASSFGLTVVFDDSFPSRRVRFDIHDADFAAALHAAGIVTKSFAIALDEKQLLALADTQENHRQFDRMGMRTFYIPSAGSQQELNDLTNGLRSLFELRFINMSPAARTITVRGPRAILETITQLMETLDASRPELMLDIKSYEVDHSYARNIGLHIPSDFKLFNIPTSALAALGGQNIQDLINQLISSGGINQAGNESIQALLAQLQSQQNSIFSQPLATFGGGLTFMGVSFDQARAMLSLNESSVRTLEHVTLRASQDKDSTFKLGSRYPILNASFSPIFNNPQISQVLGNNSFTAPFPSVNYEDLGLTIKVKPQIHSGADISLQLEMQIRTLGNQSLNGVPVISNREYKGGIALKEGEPAVVAGMVTHSEQQAMNGLPGISRLAGMKWLTAENSKQEEDDELLIVITPYIVRGVGERDSPEIWMGK
jgi:general secretion pathway protein D